MQNERIDLLDKYTGFYKSLLEVVDRLSLTLVPFDRSFLQDTPSKSLSHLLDLILIEVSQKHHSKLSDLSKRLIEEVEKDRQHLPVDREKVALVSNFLRTIGFFEGDFKKQFLAYAEDHYKRGLATLLPITNLEAYTEKIGRQIQEEKERCESLFDENLGQMIFFIMKRILIDEIIREILNSNFEQMIVDNREGVLRFYYEIMKDNETFDTFLAFFDAFIKNRSEAIINTKENTVVKVHAFYDHVCRLVASVYGDDVKVKSCADRALESVIIKSDMFFAKAFAGFISECMEKSTMTRDEAKKLISDVMTLFKFIQNKKVFILTYNQRYSFLTSLILRLSKTVFISLELEKEVLERFQKECGNEFVEHSLDILEQYHKCKNIQADFEKQIMPTFKLPHVEIDFLAVSLNGWPFPSQKNIEPMVEPVDFSNIAQINRSEASNVLFKEGSEQQSALSSRCKFLCNKLQHSR